MESDRAAIIETFLNEAEEHLVLAEDATIALESHPDDAELVQALFRGVHTVKGSADSLGFGEMTRLAHAMEDVLDDVRQGAAPVDAALVTLLLEALDALRAALGLIRATGSDLAAKSSALVDRIELARGANAAARAEQLRLESAVSTGSGVRPAERTLRVRVERLDDALTRSGEITVALGRLERRLADRSRERELDVDDAFHDVERLHRELQDIVMSLRMVPMGPVLRALLRTARDGAMIHGKQVRFSVDGDEAEVDASVIEQLRDPLVHLVRNAIGHGIEAPEVRAARGKPPFGRVVARVRREAGAVTVEIEDDGGGLDRARIAERARATGRLSAGRTPTEAELFALVFEPGFSTAERVTDLSGRGVGMDAVKRSIEALRGTVSIASREGSGTTVTLRLPISLAVFDGFGVEVRDETFLLPREAVRECLSLRGLGPSRAVVSVRGEPVPCVRLADVLGVERGDTDESVVVIASAAGHLGLVVDGLVGEVRAVIKPMSALFRRVRTVTGFTVLPSGRVALVFDVAGLLADARRLPVLPRSEMSAERR